jgi:hypothetical protein
VAGELDWNQFQVTVGSEIQRLRSSSLIGGVRVYGEMVGLLWSANEFAAAIRLEEYWNRLLQSTSFKLYCGYPIDIFTDEFQHPLVEAVIGAHTHMIPTGENGDVQDAVSRAFEEITGAGTLELNRFIQLARYPNTKVPVAEAAILGLRRNLSKQAGDIIGAARRYYLQHTLETS